MWLQRPIRKKWVCEVSSADSMWSARTFSHPHMRFIGQSCLRFPIYLYPSKSWHTVGGQVQSALKAREKLWIPCNWSISMGQTPFAILLCGKWPWEGCGVFTGRLNRGIGLIWEMIWQLIEPLIAYGCGVLRWFGSRIKVRWARRKICQLWEETKSRVLNDFSSYRFNQALDQVFGFFRSINKYADERSPWKLAKSAKPEDQEFLYTSLASMVEALRLGNVFLAPIMPEVHLRINERLGLPACLDWKQEWLTIDSGKKLPENHSFSRLIDHSSLFFVGRRLTSASSTLVSSAVRILASKDSKRIVSLRLGILPTLEWLSHRKLPALHPVHPAPVLRAHERA